MKNFHRDQNVNGHRYIWRYTDANGESKFIPCDRFGWIDAAKYQPEVDEDGCSVNFIVSIRRNGDVTIPRESDFYIVDCTKSHWARNADVVGWHPVILAMGVGV